MSRRLVSFLGGLDLTHGRWDTPKHELFSSITDEHKGDFYNGYLPNDVKDVHGPRQPFHDIHCKLEGPVAYDVFQNFIERWKKQGMPKQSPVFVIDEKLLAIINASTHDHLPINESEKEWGCQIYRSITSDSAVFHSPHKLTSKGNRVVEASILEAYIQMIRASENFIYIENQFFYGSSHWWSADERETCQNIIPIEISMKIVTKIKKGERFSAYIVTPMFAESPPWLPPVQEMLYFQNQTMEMMYKQIAQALTDVGSHSHPTEYLLFLCLGKREGKGKHLELLETPTLNDKYGYLLRQSLRLPIYVHSKMMIIDDVYIILGSANINERSLSGTRDTEINVACWQPFFEIHNPVGDVCTFRKSLFTEHFCGWHNSFQDPSSIECIRKVKEASNANWTKYIGPPGSVTEGHMLPFPVEVQKDGTLFQLEGTNATFPDFPKAKVAGKKILPFKTELIRKNLKISGVTSLGTG